MLGSPLTRREPRQRADSNTAIVAADRPALDCAALLLWPSDHNAIRTSEQRLVAATRQQSLIGPRIYTLREVGRF
jgi:hypothetical protein